MSIAFIVLLALGLAMDAFAVSVSCGLCVLKNRFTNALKIAAFFGFFQWGMLYSGWLAGSAFRSYIEPVDHWIAFALLAFIGVKMWLESLEEGQKILDLTNLKLLFTLSVATSIDALAAGISISALGYDVLAPSLYVGIITFVLSYLGVIMGCWMTRYENLQKYLDKLGAVILIGIGLKILYEHLS